MKKMNRCPACGRQRKESHERRCGTDKTYNSNCMTYDEFKKSVHYGAIALGKKLSKIPENEALLYHSDIPIEFREGEQVK